MVTVAWNSTALRRHDPIAAAKAARTGKRAGSGSPRPRDRRDRGTTSHRNRDR